MDLLFLKRLNTKHWLGLRMPTDLNIVAGTDNKTVVETQLWTLDALPKLDWADAAYYGPAAVAKDVPGGGGEGNLAHLGEEV